ncbi:unnamed protein product, partial [Scytosiphon promiscuus]
VPSVPHGHDRGGGGVSKLVSRRRAGHACVHFLQQQKHVTQLHVRRSRRRTPSRLRGPRHCRQRRPHQLQQGPRAVRCQRVLRLLNVFVLRNGGDDKGPEVSGGPCGRRPRHRRAGDVYAAGLLSARECFWRQG